MSFLRRIFGPRPEPESLSPSVVPPASAASSSVSAPPKAEGKTTTPLPPILASDAPATLRPIINGPLDGPTAPLRPLNALNAQSADMKATDEPTVTPSDTDQAMFANPANPITPTDTPVIKVDTGRFTTSGTPAAPEIIDLSADAFGATRPLTPPPTYRSAPNKHLIYASNSDVGQQRSNNQDALFSFFSMHVSAEERPDFGLFAVADGMGGHQEGEKASAIATRIVSQHIIDQLYLKMVLGSKDAERPIIAEVLSDAILRANEAVSHQIPEGGTTLTAAVIMGDMAYLGHVGDSRAYLVTEDGFEQITRDHSLVQRLIELDQLTPEEAQHHSQKNVLYRAIGQSDNLEVDAVTRRLPAGARLLICSDGLWGLVPDAQLADIVRNTKTPQEAVDKMIATANERGGPDNITAVLVQLPG